MAHTHTYICSNGPGCKEESHPFSRKVWLKRMACSFCGKFPPVGTGQTCRVCITCNRLVGYLRIFGFHPSQEEAVVAVLRSTIGTISDLAEEAQSSGAPGLFASVTPSVAAGILGQASASTTPPPAPPAPAAREANLREGTPPAREEDKKESEESQEESESEDKTEEDVDVGDLEPEERRALKAERASPPKEKRETKEEKPRNKWEKVEEKNPTALGLCPLPDPPQRSGRDDRRRPRSPSHPPPDRLRGKGHGKRRERSRSRDRRGHFKKKKKNRGQKKRERGKAWKEKREREAREQWRQRREPRGPPRPRRGHGQAYWGGPQRRGRQCWGGLLRGFDSGRPTGGRLVRRCLFMRLGWPT